MTETLPQPNTRREGGATGLVASCSLCVGWRIHDVHERGLPSRSTFTYVIVINVIALLLYYLSCACCTPQ